MKLVIYYYPSEGGLEFVLSDGSSVVDSSIIDGNFETISIVNGMDDKALKEFAWNQVPKGRKVDYFNLVWVFERTYSLNLINGGTKVRLNDFEKEKRKIHYEDVYRRILFG